MGYEARMEVSGSEKGCWGRESPKARTELWTRSAEKGVQKVEPGNQKAEPERVLAGWNPGLV